ncbi:MAG: CdaR family transcriptional regulator [Cellulosilyticaceae bacterium]
MNRIDEAVAAQIVEAIGQVVETDINFINKEGIIIASTDTSRLGDFHEAGYEAIKMRKTMIISKEEAYQGTRTGINYPIIIDQQVIGVIGLTGKPEKLMKYGFLASKITEIFIKEDQLTNSYESRKKLIQYMMNKCIYEKEQDIEQLEDILQKLHIKSSAAYNCVIIEIKKSNVDIMSIENKLLKLLEQYQIELYTYYYPKRFVAFLPATRLKEWLGFVCSHEEVYKEVVNCGIGPKRPLLYIGESYAEAKIALQYGVQEGVFYKESNQLDIELLLEQVGREVKDAYIQKVLGKLTKEEVMLLEKYYTYNMSLKETAEALFIHKNTVQYRLDKIAEKTGLNPREVKASMRIFLAMHLKNSK